MNMNFKFSKITIVFFLCSFFFKIIPSVGYTSQDLATSTFVINTAGSYEFASNMEYVYTPTTVADSTPMIKIVASDVIIDFNKVGIYNADQTSLGWTAIEIGWTPAELLADPTRFQPTNITIRNLALYNFDAGILIHGGVQGVNISECDFYDIALGIGVLGTSTSVCQDLQVRNVSLFGYGENFHGALVNMKTLIETTYGYGSNYFMPLRSDPLNSNTVDVYTYYGMWINNLMIATFRNLIINKIGYKNYLTVSEGNGLRTRGIGLRIQNSTRLTLNNVATSGISSEVKAVGLQLDGVREIELINSSFSYNTSAVRAVGIEITNSTSLPFSAEALHLKTVETKSNTATSGTAIGLDITSVRGLRGTGITSKYNMGSLASYGLYTTNLFTVDLRDSTFSENTATRLTNDVATTQGIVSAGFYGTNVNSVQITNVDFSSMQGLNSAYGLYLASSTSCQFWDCRFVGNVVTSMRSGEAAAIRSQQDAQEISKFGPCVTAASTGAYGVFLTGCRYFKFERCSALSNVGHRAVGFEVQTSRAVALWDCFASTQNSTGQMFDGSFLTDNVANPTAIPIISFHKPLLFGDSTKTTVDAVTATDLFLSSVETVRAAQLAGTTPTYADLKTIVATSSLMQAVIARYRLWSVAIGIHAHNVTGFLVKNCTCVGQVSLFDSGMGICFTGRNTGHSIDTCNASFNVGGAVAVQTVAGPSALYTNSYNLLGLSPFWKTLLMNKTPWSLSTNASAGADVNSVAFSPDGTLLAVGAADNNVYIYNTTTGALTQTLTGHTTPVLAVAWRPDGTELATGDTAASDNIKIWETVTWTVSQNLTQPSGTVHALAWLFDGTSLASGGTGGATNIVIWDTGTWTASQNLAHGAAIVQAVAWSPDGSTLVSASSDTSNNMMVWDTTSWLSTNTLSGHSNGVTSVSYSTSGTMLASGSADTTVKVWNTTAWTVSQTLSASAGVVNSVKFKPDDKLIAAGYASNIVNVWKTTDWGTLEATLSDATGPVTAVDWNFNGRLLASGSTDDSFRIYNTNIFKQAATTNDVGLYTGSSNYIAQDSLVFGSAIDGNSVFIDLKGTQHNLVSPVGPIGAGIVMGDMIIEGIVQNTSLYGNFGHSGHCYGVLFDKAFSVTLEKNTISGNSTNAHGFVSGVMDVTTSSPNLYMRNTLEGNKCSIFNNANYIVPFNPADPNTLAFPIQKFLNGNFLTTQTTSYDNIEFLYSLDSTLYPYESLTSNPIDSNLRSYWTSSNSWA